MMDSLMLYLHVPFCVKKCHYCDFLSFVCGEETRGAYVGALCEELRMRGGKMKGRTVSSVFFGGGTPSLLSPAQISEIMTVVREIFVLTDDAEITMECNPGTIHGEAGCMAEEKARAAEDAVCTLAFPQQLHRLIGRVRQCFRRLFENSPGFPGDPG